MKNFFNNTIIKKVKPFIPVIVKTRVKDFLYHTGLLYNSFKKNSLIKSLNHQMTLLLNRDYRYYHSELKRIAGIPDRYTHTNTKILGSPLEIVDSSSFLFTFKEIMEKEIYKFNSCDQNPYIIDCGANIGLSIIYFKKLYPGSEIVAFEPDRKIFEVLSFNIKSFNLENITLINKGVWKGECKLKFFSEGSDSGRIAVEGDGNITEIETLRLREYLKKPVDFLKIDIEGAETDVLKDCSDLLKNVKNIFIEYHSFVNKTQELDIILKILTDSGFRYYTETYSNTKTPFCTRNIALGMDLLVHIYGYKGNLKDIILY